MVWTDDDIIKSIKEGRDDGIVFLYSTYRKEFCRWAVKHYPADHDIAEDAFQETMLALRFNLAHNRIGEMQSTLKTYLFAIGKNQLINRLKKRHREISSDDLTLVQHQQPMVKGDPEELTERQERIKNLIKKMEEPCHSILKMFYYQGFSMEVIAQRMHYKNEDVAKSQKARCIKKIREALTASR